MAKRSKYTEEFVKNFLSEIGCELLSPYTGVKDSFEYRCICGEIATANFDRFINAGQKGCRNCRGERSNENNKLKFEDVKKYFEDNGCVLLEEKYVNSKTKMKYICKCGEESYISWNHFRKGQRCKQCAIKQNVENQKFKYEEVKDFFESNGFILLDDEYKNTHSELNCICVCGNKVEKSFVAFKMAPKCTCHINYSVPLKRRYTKDDLIEYFWMYYEEFGKYPSINDLKNNESYPSVSSYQRLWGGYNDFLKEIGIMSDYGWLIDDENILKEYYHLNDIELINNLLSKRRSESTIRHRANQLGLKVSYEKRYDCKNFSKEEVISMLNGFVNKYNRTPSLYEFVDEYKEVSESIFRRLFGTWNNALIEAGIELKIKSYNFTEEDLSLMVDMYKNGESNISIAEYFNIDPTGVIYYMNKKGVELKNHRWNDEELNYLKRNYKHESFENLLRNLPNVTLDDIFRKASHLGLKRDSVRINIQKVIASDGTLCLSYSEYKIHEILIHNNIIFKKEEYYKDIFKNDAYGKIRCDWLINNNNIIIEYFGMNSPQYIQKSKRKKEICKQNGKPLISLYYYDFKNNYKGLKNKFKEYGYELIIPNFITDEYLKQQNKEIS